MQELRQGRVLAAVSPVEDDLREPAQRRRGLRGAQLPRGRGIRDRGDPPRQDQAVLRREDHRQGTHLRGTQGEDRQPQERRDRDLCHRTDQLRFRYREVHLRSEGERFRDRCPEEVPERLFRFHNHTDRQGIGGAVVHLGVVLQGDPHIVHVGGDRREHRRCVQEEPAGGAQRGLQDGDVQGRRQVPAQVQAPRSRGEAGGHLRKGVEGRRVRDAHGGVREEPAEELPLPCPREGILAVHAR